MLRRSTALAYLTAAAVLVFAGGSPSEPSFWLFGFVFLLWVASPVIFGLWVARWIRGGVHFGFLASVILLAVFGFGLQWHTLFIGPSDAQNGLALIFGPLYQWIAICGAFIIARILARYVFKP